MSLMELIHCYDGLSKLGLTESADKIKKVIERFVDDIKKTQDAEIKAKKNEKKEE